MSALRFVENSPSKNGSVIHHSLDHFQLTPGILLGRTKPPLPTKSQKNWQPSSSCQFEISKLSEVRLLLDLLQQGETRVGVFRDLVASRQCVDSTFTGFSGKEVKGDLLAAFKLLFAFVEEIFFAVFGALYAVSHGMGYCWV